MENQSLKQTELQSPHVAECIMMGARRLAAAGVESARLDAELLLGCVLQMTREQLLVNARLKLSVNQIEQYQSLLLRRLQREPVAYIIGSQEFWSLNFLVTRDVLVPRPETELLVEIGLKHVAESKRGERLRILDLATGSGVIAVSLASELHGEAEVFATDISPQTLTVARYNAARNGVDRDIRFFQGDLFAAVDHRIDCEFDLILANPPYISRSELANLEPEVSRWEPLPALDGGLDGLDFYRRIAQDAPCRLRHGGALVLEIGAAMGAEVLALFKSVGAYTEGQIYKDYSGNERVVLASKATAPMSLD